LPEQTKPKTNPLIWIVVMAISGALVLFVFLSLYKKGESIGEVIPKTETAVKTESIQAALDLEKFKTATPELVAKGEALFQINCASCHGPKGQGDGPRAAELNPRPRNYHTEKFRYGASGSQVFNTITNGSPGTSMPSFALLPPQDRWALVHFVRSQVPNPPKEEEGLAGVEKPSTNGTASKQQTQATVTAVAPTQEVEGPRIPIQLAMQRVALPSTESIPPLTVELEKRGSVLFARYCMPCHGPGGESRQTVYLLRINPERLVRSGNLQNPKAAWVQNKDKFIEIVTKGFPGHLMPGLKTLDQSELDALYAQVLKLATGSNEKK